MQLEFDKYDYNPLYWHLKKYVADSKIRYIYVYGGSSAGKTYTITQLLNELILTENVNVMVYRKESTTIWESVYNDFKTICSKINDCFIEATGKPVYRILKRFINLGDLEIIFKGMDDPEKAKGIAGYKYIYFNEVSKAEFIDLKELRRRMRGLKGQTLIMDWNPISEDHFLKTEIIDRETWTDLPTQLDDCPGISELAPGSFVKINKKGNSVLIKTTYKDNFWVAGHPIDGYGFLDENALDEFEWMRKYDPPNYLIYALGEWGMIKKGGEFFKAFDPNVHVKPSPYDPDSAIHISIDNNVYPYIAVTMWQVAKDGAKYTYRQVAELPCKDPDNTASRAGKRALEWLNLNDYHGTVYVYGDPTTKARNTIDDAKRSFLDLFILPITGGGYEVELRFFKAAPPVHTTGAFINAIYAGGIKNIAIEIDELCTMSRGDYIRTKEDKDGGIFKKRVKDPDTGITFEECGHLSDTKRYFLCKIMETEFKAFINRLSNYKDVEIEINELLEGEL